MGHVGQELGLVLASDLELGALVLDGLEEPGVRNRHRRVGGERLQERGRAGRDLPAARLVVPREHAHRLAAGDHRDHEEAVRAQRLEEVLRLQIEIGGQRLVVAEEERPALAEGLVHRAGLDERNLEVLEVLPLVLGKAGAGKVHQPVSLRAHPPHVDAVEDAHARGLLQDPAELLLERERLLQGRGESVELLHVSRQASQLPTLGFDLAKQARVLDGECRLGREGFQDVDHLGRKLAGCLPNQGQAADDLFLAEQRHRHHRPEASSDQRVADLAPVDAGHRDVRNLDGFARFRGAAHHAFSLAQRHCPQCSARPWSWSRISCFPARSLSGRPARACSTSGRCCRWSTRYTAECAPRCRLAGSRSCTALTARSCSPLFPHCVTSPARRAWYSWTDTRTPTSG